MTIGHFVGQNGIRLVADVSGNPSEPVVVLLHGGGQTRHAWRRTAAALNQRGFYTVALDLRGHGDSDWAADGDYTTTTQAADIAAVLAQLPSRPAIIGASLGGLIALTTLGESAEPALATSLILVDVTPQVDPDGQARIIGFMQANPQGFASLEDAAEVVAAYLPNRPKPSDPSGLKRNLRLRDGRYYWHWDPSFFDTADVAPEYMQQRYEAAARRIAVPTLLVRGTHSELVKEENVRHFLDLIPSAQYVDVHEAGHMVAGDSNDAFSNAITNFLEQNR
ncbi:MAG: protein ABHD11-like [Verrucomicrobiaceae bacterium]|nr:protein ABHD11-like [Verrucomicrobiaceae bacterium]